MATVEFGDSRLPSRFWSKVRIDESGCWLCTGGLNKSGYARFQNQGVSETRHRIICRLQHGENPPDEPFALHSCDVRNCINPHHLRWGSAADNSRDMADRKRSPFLAKTECPSGHPYAGDNLIVRKGSRFCRECARVKGLAYYYRTRVNKNACPNGHPYTEGSYRLHKSRGHRQCLQCVEAVAEKQRERRRAGA